MKLITEISYKVAPKKESKGKKYYIEGIFIQGDIVNGNKRMYPMELLKREVKRYRETLIDQNRAVGELDHPDTPSVNYKAASHKIISLEQDGNNFIGKALILDTPNGLIAKALIDGGVQLAVSTRGIGSVKEDSGRSIVQDDFVLSTIDIVSDPSAPEAFVNGVLESKEWVLHGSVFVEKNVDVIVDICREDKLLEEFQKFMNSLK